MDKTRKFVVTEFVKLSNEFDKWPGTHSLLSPDMYYSKPRLKMLSFLYCRVSSFRDPSRKILYVWPKHAVDQNLSRVFFPEIDQNCAGEKCKFEINEFSILFRTRPRQNRNFITYSICSMINTWNMILGLIYSTCRHIFHTTITRFFQTFQFSTFF